jgi:aspartyl-tRNA(Asn)/glutamyl-tRNA(Gln) amidotransferase subunit A
VEDTQLASLSLTQAAELVRRGEVSPVELTHAYLERIESLNPHLNCFITVTPESALQRARQAEQEVLVGETIDGRPLGALHGIPLALKDLFETQGVRTTHGSKFYQDYVPDFDAVVVASLKAAGAILLGKTNMHEIALGVTNVNPHFGPCRNPWALERISGGSSGGSAVALAARLCLGSLGSDTGGSIRIPSSLCGVVGLKPTFGRVSLRGVIPLSWNLDHVGPLARSVMDVALLLREVAGYDPQDPGSVQAAVDDYLVHIQEGVQGWRMALADDEFFAQTDSQVLAAVQEAARVFAGLGARVQPVPFPGARQAALANGQMVVSDAAAFHLERLQSRPDDFGEDIRERLQTGMRLSSSDYVLARRTQSVLRRQFEQFFDRYDVLLMPATPVTAPLIEGPDALDQARLLTRYTAPFNLTGLPAISLPCGFSTDGLPIGLQIVSRPWAEVPLLRAAFAYEQATEWHWKTPEWLKK